MCITNSRRQSYQRSLQQQRKKSDSVRFFNLLTSPDLLAVVEESLPDHRERFYPPTETLSMFMAQALNDDRSCQKAVNNYVVNRIKNGLSPISTATGAYCNARQRLPLNLIMQIHQCTNKLLTKQLPQQWLWHGRKVRLVDGMSVTMPDTKENQEKFPQHSNQGDGLGFPICRIVGVLCLSSGIVVRALVSKFSGKGSGEQTLLRNMLDSFDAGDIVVGDALFSSYFLWAYLLSHQIDGVFEQMGSRRKSTDFRKGKRLGEKDHLIELMKPKAKPDWMEQEDYDKAPEKVIIRELKTGGKILVTSLLSAKKISKKMLQDLYRRRWEIEVNFRHLKTTMKMDSLSCKTPDMIEKEIWIYFLAYNLIRLLMAQAAVIGHLSPVDISFKHTLQLWTDWNQGNNKIDTDIQILFILILQKRVGNRPGRIEPRAIKQTHQKYPKLQLSRDQARELVRKNGHDKKLK